MLNYRPLALSALLLPAPLAAQQTIALTQPDRLLTEKPAPLFSIGQAEGQSWEMLSSVRALAFDQNDHLYILDAGNSRVLRFDASGRFVREFGRKGGGPGEFMVATGMVVTAEEVVVNDAQRRTLVVFAGNGVHLRNVPYRDAGGPASSLQSDPSGVTYMTETTTPDARYRSVVRLALRGNVTPQQTYRVSLPRMLPFSMTMNGQQLRGYRDPIYGADLRVAVLPDGNLAVQEKPDYEIRILDRKGVALRTITRPIKARKVTRQDQEAWDRRRLADFKAARPDAPPAKLENVPFAEFMEVISGVRSDPQGRLWVQRREADGAERGPIDLIAATGRYIGTLAPQPLPAAVSSSGRAAWIERDVLGFERVIVRKLPESWK